MSRERSYLTTHHLVNTWENKVVYDVVHTIKENPYGMCRVFTDDRSQSYRFYKRIKAKLPYCEVRREVDFYGVYHIYIKPPCYN